MNSDNYEVKYKLLMFLMMAFGVIAALPIFLGCYFLFIKETEGVPYFYIIGGAGISIISFLLIVVISKRMQFYKEKALYDEFGVRKDSKNRLTLNSKDRKELELQSLMELEKAIPRVALDKMIHDGSSDPVADLNKMIGIKPVKKRILEMKARMEFEETGRKKNRSSSEEGHHMIFTGAPGTGKTTVARIMTGLLYEYEYIDKNKLIECDGNFLKSADANLTQMKVRYMCKMAYGGVLFIDEAYALSQSGDEAGLQAVATLIKEMEDARDKFVVILAGYTQEMKDLLDVNPGFRSRIKEYLDFPDYTDEELFDIFKLMCKDKGFVAEDECLDSFNVRMKKERSLASWGNARTVRNLVEETIDHHAYRFINDGLDKNMRYKITSEDIGKNPKETI